MSYVEGITSPDAFKKWTAISMVASALERRVWVQSVRGRTFVHLYVLLMAAPGVGKGVLEVARELMEQAVRGGGSTPAFYVAPDNMSKASLLDRLARAKQVHIPPSGPIETYHALCIIAEEFSVLFPAYDNEYLGVLNSIWNGKEQHSESRRTGSVKELTIEKPLLNLIAGYQPALMATTFPEEAWSSGLSRRLIMVHSSESPYRDLYYRPQDRPQLRSELLGQLASMRQLWGNAKWQQEAFDLVAEWDREGQGKGGSPIPTHSKLSHYLRSRTHHILKLCLISAVSRSGALVVEHGDAVRAIAWLTEAERSMPDVFREMLGKSDTQVIEETYYFVQALWAKDRQKPVQGELIRRFLLARAPHDKIESLMQSADRAGIIVRQAGTDLWLPRPRQEHGME